MRVEENHTFACCSKPGMRSLLGHFPSMLFHWSCIDSLSSGRGWDFLFCVPLSHPTFLVCNQWKIWFRLPTKICRDKLAMKHQCPSLFHHQSITLPTWLQTDRAWSLSCLWIQLAHPACLIIDSFRFSKMASTRMTYHFQLVVCLLLIG